MQLLWLWARLLEDVEVAPEVDDAASNCERWTGVDNGLLWAPWMGLISDMRNSVPGVVQILWSTLGIWPSASCGKDSLGGSRTDATVRVPSEIEGVALERILPQNKIS